MIIILNTILTIYGAMFCIALLTDNDKWFVSQSVRVNIIHKLITTRIWIHSFFSQQSNLSSQYEAFEEIVRLHDSPFVLQTKPDKKQFLEFRSSAKEIFIGLYPQRNIQTCKITPIIFEYNGRQVLSYSIRDNNIYDWTEIDRKFLLYIHGGAFIYGDIQTYSGYECYLSREYHMPVIHIEYGLAPNHTLFCAVDDVVAVYMAMLEIDSTIYKRMIGMGDSSGGLLWLLLTQRIVQAKRPVPLALVLFSPWVDISFEYVEWDSSTNQKRILFSHGMILNLIAQVFHINYTGSRSIDNMRYFRQLNKANPVRYSFEGFPPLYVSVGTEEVFITDAHILQRKIRENNGQIILEEGYGLMHTYSMFHLWFPEARCSQKKIRKFIDQF